MPAIYECMTKQEWFAEILKADERLRNYPDHKGQPQEQKPRAAAMRWALALARTDLLQLSVGGWSDLQFEVDCLQRYELGEPTMPDYIVMGGGRPWEPAPAPTPEHILRVQKWLRVSLSTILNKEYLCHKFPALTHELYWRPDPTHQTEGRWFAIAVPEVTDEDFLSTKALWDLLCEHVNNIRACPCCKETYLRDRNNQRYCSRICLQRQLKRNKLKIPPERYGKRGRPAGESDGKKKPTKTTAKQKGGTHHGTKR